MNAPLELAMYKATFRRWAGTPVRKFELEVLIAADASAGLLKFGRAIPVGSIHRDIAGSRLLAPKAQGVRL